MSAHLLLLASSRYATDDGHKLDGMVEETLWDTISLKTTPCIQIMDHSVLLVLGKYAGDLPFSAFTCPISKDLGDVA